MKTTIISLLAAALALATAISTEEVRLRRASDRIATLVAQRTDYRNLCWSIRHMASDASQRLDAPAFAELDVIGIFAGQCGADRERAFETAERAGDCNAITHDLACARQAAAELVDMMPSRFPEFDPAFDNY